MFVTLQSCEIRVNKPAALESAGTEMATDKENNSQTCHIALQRGLFLLAYQNKGRGVTIASPNSSNKLTCFGD